MKTLCKWLFLVLFSWVILQIADGSQAQARHRRHYATPHQVRRAYRHAVPVYPAYPVYPGVHVAAPAVRVHVGTGVSVYAPGVRVHVRPHHGVYYGW